MRMAPTKGFRPLINAGGCRVSCPLTQGDTIMTLCPIAIVAGCKKCPAFSVCPLKSVIGDAPPADAKKEEEKKK